METGIVDLISFDPGSSWRPWAVWYFFLVGSATGALLIAYIAALRDENAPTIRPALFAAALCGIAAPFPLLADLHQPARFMHFYLTLSSDSIMWWGAWFLPAFVAGVAALVVLYSPYGARFSAYRRYVWAWSAIFAVAVLAYTAGEMAVVRARPLWHSAFFPALLTLSAFVSGAGVISIVAALRGETPGIAPRVVGLGSILFVLGVAAWVAMGWDERVGAGGSFFELAVNDEPIIILLFMGGVCGLGAAALSVSRSAFISSLSGVLAVLGAFTFRWHMFMGAQAQPKTEAGFLPYALFTDTDALVGLIGTVGLLAMIVVVLSLILVPEDDGEKTHTHSHTAL